ncbi:MULTISPECIES: TetR/AcrR family transcriptional regulator [unclassified Leptolyngbya]|uniref:TetR/AcrR family transcriptional regulator n=1 Tax=unclassified Leptolyngbya TaxID=2650499 RepID=UPI001689699D|nr:MULTISPECIES: TetR/AcrR family transcriptional regulator [unclassified Leptolyngbya]MBD1908979.1 TetR/AcrR family transcriptional regulator [Leptolyngbya sp. FACHB-8]MBD2158130.1 TetR/AcrR family transcriptional regulator [Leptolyngbya sp. FACHB-16]
MKPSRRASIGMEKRERTRSHLIESAYRVFARKETDAVTIDDIIAEAGVARGTFYNYFQTREDVLRAVAASLSDVMNQKIWAQYAAISDPAERMAIGLRQFLHQAMRDATWGWVIVRIGLVAAPLSETIERGLLSDLEAGIRLERFHVDSVQATVDLVLGTSLMAMRTTLKGHTEPNYPEQITKLILKSLGVHNDDAEAIAFKALEPFPEE